jgi:hypothetical protein
VKKEILNCLSGFLLGFYICFDFFSYHIGLALPFISPVVLPAIFLVGSLIVSIVNNINCVKKVAINFTFITTCVFILYLISSTLLGSNQTYGFEKLSIFLFKGFIAGLSVVLLSASFDVIKLKPIIYFGIFCAFLIIAFGREIILFPNRIVFGTANPIWEARSLMLILTLCVWYDKTN